MEINAAFDGAAGKCLCALELGSSEVVVIDRQKNDRSVWLRRGSLLNPAEMVSSFSNHRVAPSDDLSSVGVWRERLGVESDAEMREWKASLCRKHDLVQRCWPEWRRLLLRNMIARRVAAIRTYFRLHRVSMVLESVDAMTAYRATLQSFGIRQYWALATKMLDLGILRGLTRTVCLYETRRIAIVGLKIALPSMSQTTKSAIASSGICKCSSCSSHGCFGSGRTSTYLDTRTFTLFASFHDRGMYFTVFRW